MNDNLTKVQERTVQYWFVDGLAELGAGLVALFLGVLFWVWRIIFTWRWSLPVIIFVGLIVSFGLRLLIQRIKERTTYLRTGYASPFTGLESRWSVILTVVFTLILLGLNSYLSIQGPRGLLWTPGLAGLTFAFIFAWTGVLTKLRRFYFLALLSLCAGVVLSVLGLDYFRGVAILAGIIGLTLLVQGTRVRKAYNSQYPQPDMRVDE